MIQLGNKQDSKNAFRGTLAKNARTQAPAQHRDSFSSSYLRQKVVIRIITPTIHALVSVATKRKCCNLRPENRSQRWAHASSSLARQAGACNSLGYQAGAWEPVGTITERRHF